MLLIDETMNFSEELVKLARLGDIQKLQPLLSLLAEGAWINTTEEDGSTALHEAAKSGHQVVAEMLLHQGADINFQTWWRTTPLHLTADEGHHQVVKILLNRGAITNTEEVLGATPLHNAARKGHKAVVEMLLQAGAEPNRVDDLGDTPLHCAAANSNSDKDYIAIIELLVSQGALMQVRNREGNTPLHQAALRGQTTAIQHLLQQGAYSDDKANQVLSRLGKGELFGLNIERDTILYTILLLAGADLTGKVLPESLRKRWHHMESTVIEWLSPLRLAAEQCRELTPRVLRALPRLLYWLDRAEQAHDKEENALKDHYATSEPHVQGLKHFFWIPEDETGVRASVMQGLQASAVPTELLRLIREKLIVPVLTELLVKLYALPPLVARYLVKDSRARPVVYAAFRSQLFQHDWQTPCASPTTCGASYVDTHSPSESLKEQVNALICNLTEQ